MITRTSTEFEIKLDPKDELMNAEMQIMLAQISEIIDNQCGFEWESVGSKFIVSISTVDVP